MGNMSNEKKIKTILYSLDEVESVAAELACLAQNAAIMTFTGPLGAGKTTMIRSLLRAVGVMDSITSPTYTYVNVYKNGQGRTFYHFDLYRIDSVDDFVQAGFNEYLYVPQSMALIEWPDVIAPLYRENVLHVSIDYCQDLDKRVMVISRG